MARPRFCSSSSRLYAGAYAEGTASTSTQGDFAQEYTSRFARVQFLIYAGASSIAAPYGYRGLSYGRHESRRCSGTAPGPKPQRSEYFPGYGRCTATVIAGSMLCV